MSYLIAAIDESVRPGQYLLCATVVSTADRANIRQSLRALLLPNQRRLHMYTERPGRKRMLLKAVSQIPGVRCHIAIGRHAQDIRRRCLHRLTTHLLSIGVPELIFDRVDHGTARLDQQTMAEFRVEWRHEGSHHEPLLWISDAVVHAYGMAGEWRRIVEPLVEEVLQIE